MNPIDVSSNTEYVRLMDSLDKWIKVRGLTESSAKMFRWVSEDFLSFCSSRGLPVSKESVIEYTNSLNVSSGQKRWRWLILKRCFQVWGLEWFDTVSESMYKPKPQERVRRVVATMDDFIKLYESTDKLWMKLVLRIAAETGARRQQIALMLREHFNPDKKTLYIPPVKRSLDRVEILSDELVDMLKNYLKNRSDSDPHLIVDDKGNPLSLEVMNEAFRRLKKKSGLDIKGLGYHSFRRAWSTWLYEMGMREMEIQKAGGWKSPSMVSIYVHLSPTEIIEREASLHPLKSRDTDRGK